MLGALNCLFKWLPRPLGEPPTELNFPERRLSDKNRNADRAQNHNI
jgi:hypothetical protein